MIGTKLDQYEITARLGAGGMGEVYQAVERAARSPRRTIAAGWIAAAVLAILAAGAGVALLRRATAESPMMRLQVDLPLGDTYNFALSPDGGSLIYQATVGGRDRLWLRRFDSGQDRPLEGTEGSYRVFWSPNGLSAGFFAEGWLKRIDLTNGYVRKVVALNGDPRPGSWNDTGTILYSLARSGLFKVSAEGGLPAEPVTTLLPGQSSHRYLKFLPDGRHFLFLALGEQQVKGIYLGSLGSKETTRLMDGEPAFTFLAPDYLIFAREGALWAQQLSVDAGKLQGPLMPVAPKIWVDAQVTGAVAAAASSSGSLAYRPAPSTRQLLWLDRRDFMQATGGNDRQMPAAS